MSPGTTPADTSLLPDTSLTTGTDDDSFFIFMKANGSIHNPTIY